MDTLLADLIQRRSELAHAALATPGDGGLFEYGRMVGQFQGLSTAIEAVQQMLAEKEDDE